MTDFTYAVSGRLPAEARDYWELLKPRVMSLVVFTGLVGMVMAPGHLHPVLFFTAILCIAVAAGASGAINMWYDRDIDAVMLRTLNRPIPSGRVSAEEALTFGVALAVGSVAMMGLAVNLIAAGLLAGSILFYIFIYTVWLKRRTPQNIVIGGAAGAFPPVIGWAAVSGDIGWAPWLLFGLIFLWTPPHFWALALYRSDDYARAGVPMLPVVAGARATQRQILIYSLILIPFSLTPILIGLVGWVYGAGALLLGAEFLRRAVKVLRMQAGEVPPARGLFLYSILYLFLLFLLLPADRLVTWILR